MNWWKLIASIIICELAGVVGSVFTFSEITTWYTSLQKPFFNPPNWVFGPVWLTLYALIGLSLYIIWIRGADRTALKWFSVQLALNALWSIVFFGAHSLLWGLVTIVLLWLAILATIMKFAKISKIAAWLLVPYIIWVTIASMLNFSVWLLNP